MRPSPSCVTWRRNRRADQIGRVRNYIFAVSRRVGTERRGRTLAWNRRTSASSHPLPFICNASRSCTKRYIPASSRRTFSFSMALREAASPGWHARARTGSRPLELSLADLIADRAPQLSDDVSCASYCTDTSTPCRGTRPRRQGWTCPSPRGPPWDRRFFLASRRARRCRPLLQASPRGDGCAGILTFSRRQCQG